MAKTQRVGDKLITWEKVEKPNIFTETWEEGTRVSGFVLYYSPDTGETDFNDNECGFIDLQDFDERRGSHRVRLETIVLKELVRCAQPAPGMALGIKCLGKVKSSKSGNQYKNFEVYKGAVSLAEGGGNA